MPNYKLSLNHRHPYIGKTWSTHRVFSAIHPFRHLLGDLNVFLDDNGGCYTAFFYLSQNPQHNSGQKYCSSNFLLPANNEQMIILKQWQSSLGS